MFHTVKFDQTDVDVVSVSSGFWERKVLQAGNIGEAIRALKKAGIPMDLFATGNYATSQVLHRIQWQIIIQWPTQISLNWHMKIRQQSSTKNQTDQFDKIISGKILNTEI